MNVITNINEVTVREPRYRDVLGDRQLHVGEGVGAACLGDGVAGPLVHHLHLLLHPLVVLAQVAGVDHLLDQEHHHTMHAHAPFLQGQLNLGPDLNGNSFHDFHGNLFLFVLDVSLWSFVLED